MSSQRQTICFISYCHDDIDRVTLDYLKYLLREESDQKYELLIDEDLHYGGDLDAFMAMLDKVDAVLLLLSPAYKRKVLDRRGGVYAEFLKIQRRYQELQEERRKGKTLAEIEGYFELMPVILAGDMASSVPDEIAHLKCLSLVGLRVSRDEQAEFLITEHVRKKYVPEIRKIADRLRVITSVTGQDFKALYDQYYQRLFVELKADWSNPGHEHHGYVESLFVKTHAYKQVEREAVYFIIGRKGSGKSTVTGVLHHKQRARFIGHIAVNADDFDLEGPYSLFHLDQVESDTKNVVTRQRCFELAWEGFLHLWVMELLVAGARTKALTAYQAERIVFIERALERIAPARQTLSESERMRAYFAHSFAAVIAFVDSAISKSRSDPQYFYSDIQLRVSRAAFLAYIMGEEANRALDEILSVTRKKFLLTLDGFDTTFDMFRRRSIVEYHDELQARALFEIEWLRALLLLVLNIRQGGQHTLHALLQVCITVPKDRFQEILMTERDSYRYHNHYCPLNWSGIELAILLRKRLQELTQSSTDRKRTAEDRLQGILKARFSHVPTELQFEYNGSSYSMPLFLYVLRHTFWRPRDVLLYYAKILAAAEELRRKGARMSGEAVRRAVKDATYDVIQSEFVNEFASSFTNIREVIGAFAKHSQFLTYAEVGDIIGHIDFKFAIGAEIVRKLEDKLEHLYQIGFLGIQVTDELRDRFNIQHRHSFYFNEGTALLRTLVGHRFAGFVFIIHPVFTEYLEIDTKGRELVLDLTWDYLHEMEAVLFANSGLS